MKRERNVISATSSFIKFYFESFEIERNYIVLKKMKNTKGCVYT